MKRRYGAAVLVVALAVTAVLWFTNRSVTPRKAAWSDVLQEAKQGGYRLLTTQQLWEYYRQHPKDLLLVDARQDWEYASGHIKGAVNFPMEPTWWSRWRKKKKLERFLGPDKNRLIVFY